MLQARFATRPSIARNLTLYLGGFGVLIFCATLIGSVLIDALADPNQLRNAVAIRLLEGAVRPAGGVAFAVEDTDGLNELKKSSTSFWFVVSDGRTLIEHNPVARPILPVDIRIDGPNLSASFTSGERRTAISTVEAYGFDGRIVLATTGARPGFLQVIHHYLLTNGIKILFGAAALALLISATIALSIRQIVRTIRGMAQAAADIAPDNPKGELSSHFVPSELHPLTRALDKALDRIAASMDQQRRFISNAAHELRTPLAILRVKIEAVEDKLIKGALVSDLHRLTALVAAMLDLARMRAETSGLQMHRLDISALSRDTLGDHASMIVDRGMDGSFEAPKVPVMILGNAIVLRSALSNLIANAISHAQTATRLVVSVTADGVVAVADNGVGIAPEYRDEIIEPFARLSSATPGTGLGLAIVREIMVSHGGSLDICETPGGGLTTRLVFAGIITSDTPV